MLVAAFVVLDLGQYLSLDYFRAERAAIESHRAAHPLYAALGGFGLYVAVTDPERKLSAKGTTIDGIIPGIDNRIEP